MAIHLRSGWHCHRSLGVCKILSISQVIPLQSGLQATVKLQGGLGLDISANVDVNIWEQELKTSVNTR